MLMISSCATPSATAAATVGDVAIAESMIFERTTALIDQAVDSGATEPTPTVIADVNRRNTTLAIRGRLLQIAADDAGVQVSDAQVNAALAAGRESTASLLGVGEAGVEDAVRDRLRLEGVVQALPAQGAPVTNVRVRFDGVSTANRDEAVALRAKFAADPAAADAAIADSPSSLPETTLSLLDNPDVGAAGLFLAEPGDVIVYPNPEGYYVLRVLERTVEDATLTSDAVLGQPVQTAANLGALLLAPYAREQGVQVNPRLGAWDPLALQVVPGSTA
jgi:hypothetical protein